MNFDPMYITYSLIALVVILVGLVVRLEIKIKKLLRGKKGESLEDSIVGALDNLQKLNSFQNEVIRHLEGVETRLNRSVQAVRTVRFNPFKGTGEGGSQSFSTAFVTENGDGAVISSLYSRDRVSVFSKPLENFESSFELTDEEREVISHSKDALK
jgi:hypothetical protein